MLLLVTMTSTDGESLRGNFSCRQLVAQTLYGFDYHGLFPTNGTTTKGNAAVPTINHFLDKNRNSVIANSERFVFAAIIVVIEVQNFPKRCSRHVCHSEDRRHHILDGHVQNGFEHSGEGCDRSVLERT